MALHATSETPIHMYDEGNASSSRRLGSSKGLQMPTVQSISQLANPSPLGLLAFAVVTWMSAILKVLNDDEAYMDGLFAGTAVFIGGLALIIAGLMQFPRNNTHSGTVFCLFGFHWLSQGTIHILRRELVFPASYSNRSDAAYYSALALATFILWIPSVRILSATVHFCQVRIHIPNQ
jgi:uncharacterized protein